MSSWKECKLGDILNFGNGKSRPKIEGDYPIYGGNGILGYANEFNYTDETIILGRVGAYCGSVYYENKPIWVSDNALSAKPKEGNHSKFLYYFLKNMDLNSHAGGSSHPLITQSLLNFLDVEICTDFEEQKAIAEVLCSFDNKIDLLHRQNQTLESLAQTLFRQWFIEEAKEEWKNKPLKEICEIKNGFAFKSNDYRETGRKIIRTMNFKNGLIDSSDVVYIDIEEEFKYTKYILEKNDFLLVMVGASLGNYSIVTRDVLPALQNQNMWNFRTLGNISQHYLNFALREIVEENIGSASGSAREFFQKGQFYEFIITVPDKTQMNKFHKYVEDNYQKIENNRKQIQTLENLRDTLLPKLLIGEIKVEI
ncbi:restriction endonuclease subunit S [Aliarcobacter cryaerophilus]|uniref:restriction endonuclease subunit S n=1 Tax=Aliarcobacter cryaerophilus TaxID=28198 RepID=UPI00112F29A9|nr:restriction endonuclease subunit S [Aliarcobacter cryaerophilus]